MGVGLKLGRVRAGAGRHSLVDVAGTTSSRGFNELRPL